MNLFSKKEVMLLRRIVNVQNEIYTKKINNNDNSDLSKKNKAINNLYKIISKI